MTKIETNIQDTHLKLLKMEDYEDQQTANKKTKENSKTLEE